jgi:hypothetical protein
MTSTNRGGTGESTFDAAQALWEAQLASRNAMEDRDPTAGDLFHWPMPLGLSLRWVLLGSDPAGRAAFCLLDDAGPRRSWDVALSSELSETKPDDGVNDDLPGDLRGNLLLRPEFRLEVPITAVAREDRVGCLDPASWAKVQDALDAHGLGSHVVAEPSDALDQDDEAKDYILQLGQTQAIIENYLHTRVYRLPISTFAQAQQPAEAARPALAAAGAQSLLESLRRELREDAFFHLDLTQAFAGRLEILAMASGVTLLHDAGEEQADPPRAELGELTAGGPRRELQWQHDETLRWSRLSEILPWMDSRLHIILTRPDGEAMEFEIQDDRS